MCVLASKIGLESVADVSRETVCRHNLFCVFFRYVFFSYLLLGNFSLFVQAMFLVLDANGYNVTLLK
jgi:hypothetical protein